MVTLVTGASGFIGSAVVRKLLERGEIVRILVRPNCNRSNIENLNIECAEGDIRDVASLSLAMQDVKSLYHIAADYRLWARDDEEIYKTNVGGTENVLSVADRNGVDRIVYTSSVCTLGTNKDGTPADENTPAFETDMVGAYKKSKFLAEKQVRERARAGAPIVIVNPSTPIGPRDVKPTPTGRTVLDAALGKVPAYVNTGLNFVHVDDVATGHLLAHDRGRIGERYILGGYNLSLKSLLWLIADATGKKPPKIELPRQALYPVAVVSELIARLTTRDPLATVNGLRLSRKLMYFSSDKAERELGYSYRPIRRALAEAIHWFGINSVQELARPESEQLASAAKPFVYRAAS